MRWKNRMTVLGLAILISFINYSYAQEAKEISCTGKVVDAQGQPIPDAKVRLYKVAVSMETLSYNVELLKEVTTKDDGTFTIETKVEGDELSGQSIILAEKEGLAIGWTNWRLNENLNNVEIKLEQAKLLTGTVVDDEDKPVADAEVGIAFMFVRAGEQPRYLIGGLSLEPLMAKTNAEGKFSFDRIPGNATLEFVVKKSGRATVSTFDPENYRGESLQFSPGQTGIKLTQPIEAKIEGMVVEKATGKPVAGIRIMATQGQNRPNFGLEPVVSGEAGTFSINALPAGKHTLQLVSKSNGSADWVAEPVEVTTEPGKTESDVKVELSKGGLLEVVVTEAENKQPVENVRIGIQNQASDRPFSVFSDKEGIARMRLAPGEYQIGYVYKEGYSSQRSQGPITIENGKTTRVEYQLAGQPKFTGVVRDEKDKPLKGVKLGICPMGGREASSDAEGKFEVSWDPRRWGSNETPVMFLVARYEEDNLAAAVEIDENTRTVDIKLKPGITFTGKVMDSDGKGIAGIRVMVMLRSERWSSSIGRDMNITDAEGKFEIKAIPAEHEYRINASGEGYGQSNIEVSANDAVDNCLDVGALTLPLANLSVSGVVVDINDKPVAGARVYCYGENQPHRNTQTDAEGKFKLDKICAGELQIGADKSGQTRLYGNIRTEGGATDVKIVVQERSASVRSTPAQPQPPSLVGRALPELKDLKIDLSPADSGDKMILVCFFDMNQRPSRYCTGKLAKQAEQLKQKDITVVAVEASKVDENALSEWIKGSNIALPVGMIQDEVEKTRFAWGVRSLPWLILTDRQHIIRAAGFGLNELDEKIKGIADVQR
jgi:protocatechuate 3,4-dioxygenase beta subunit